MVSLSFSRYFLKTENRRSKIYPRTIKFHRRFYPSQKSTFVCTHVRGWDSGPGSWICIIRGKNIVPLLYRLKPRSSPRNVCLIDKYDDLLLPGHRFLTQLQVFASGEYFESKNSVPIFRTAALCIPYTNSKVRYHISIGKCTVLLERNPKNFQSAQKYFLDCSPEANIWS